MTKRLIPAVVLALSVPLAGETPAPQTPTFRSAATLVPVDVRVLDANGNAITDLTQADFTVRENGVVQTISQFSQHRLLAAPVAPGDPVIRRVSAEPTLTPQNQRVFLLMLGRGRLQPPAKGVDAALDFVRNRLLPQDAVAVMAWNRATDFTTDHAMIAGVLERFRSGHEKIENQLASWFSGLRALYGSPAIPGHLQREIDGVFGRDGRAARDLPSVGITNQQKVVGTMTQNAEELLRDEANKLTGREGLIGLSPQAAALDQSFDQYVTQNKQTIQDVSNIYTGIEYLRYIDGEKHLVFITEDSFSLPSADDDVALAAMANDARVAIDTIHTGGLVGANVPGFGQHFRVATLKEISQLTGGVSSAFRYGADAIDRIDRATRSSYLLGYYPTSNAVDGKYRRITVQVNRPGATMLYRHGYFGRDSLAPIDRAAALSFSRIAAAGAVARDIRDLDVDVNASPYMDAGGRGVSVRINVAPERIQFALVNGRHVAALHVAVFCGDRNNELVGQRWRQVELSLTDDLYRQFMKKGADLDMRLPVSTGVRFVRAVVYDPNADLLGSRTQEIRTNAIR